MFVKLIFNFNFLTLLYLLFGTKKIDLYFITMSTTMTFNQLRRIKDSLPEGSIRSIAETLDLNVETVRNYFGGADYVRGCCVGIHIEQGPDGGIVELDDPTILDMAKEILQGNAKMPIYN